MKRHEFILVPPDKFTEWELVSTTPGIQVRRGITRHNGGHQTVDQAVLFDARDFNEEQAVTWLESQRYSPVDTRAGVDFDLSVDFPGTKVVNGMLVIPFPHMPRKGNGELVERSAKSNHLPSGAVRVWSFASTETVDVFDTLITEKAMVDAWLRDYMRHPFHVRGVGMVLQGSVDLHHDITDVVGFCRDYEHIEGKGIYAGDTIPGDTQHQRDVQMLCQNGTLTGTSIMFKPVRYSKRVLQGKSATIVTSIKLPTRSLTSAPGNFGTYFTEHEWGELQARAATALGRSKVWNGAEVQTRSIEDALYGGDGVTDVAPPLMTTEVNSMDAPRGTEMVLKWETRNGFLLAYIRDESSVVPGTMRYSRETAEGVVVMLGTLAENKEVKVVAVGFNEALWDQDQAELYLDRDTELYWNARSATDLAAEQTEEMPTARALTPVGRFWLKTQKLFNRDPATKGLHGRAAADTEQPGTDDGNNSGATDDSGTHNLGGTDEMEKAEFQEMLDQHFAKVDERITGLEAKVSAEPTPGDDGTGAGGADDTPAADGASGDTPAAGGADDTPAAVSAEDLTAVNQRMATQGEDIKGIKELLTKFETRMAKIPGIGVGQIPGDALNVGDGDGDGDQVPEAVAKPFVNGEGKPVSLGDFGAL